MGLPFGKKKNDEAAEQPKSEAKAAEAKAAETKVTGNSRYRSLAESIEAPGPKPNGFFRRMNWRRLIRKGRRQLRRELKKVGITSREDFEQIAWEIGLTYDDSFFWFWRWLRWKGAWFVTSAGLKTLLLGAAAVLLGLFGLSFLSDYSGAFTINLTADMMRDGFVLCETPDFAKPSIRLISERIKEVNNITIEDISHDVDEVDGPHNGLNYVAYTFYIRNEGDKEGSYQYVLKLNDETLDVSEAVWLMLFEDGHQLIYTKPSKDGDVERLFGYASEPPFYESSYSRKQYYKHDGMWGIETTAYAAEDTVSQGIMLNVAPGEIHKYTVIIWIEGYDPECTDAIFGGFARYSMQFSRHNTEADENGKTGGVWRTEFNDYMQEFEDTQIEHFNPDASSSSRQTESSVNAPRQSSTVLNNGNENYVW